jgi:DNA-binding winged helix-turn-helix (wHTH) protein
MVGPAFTFGPFVLDAADRRLLRDGQPVEVSARYFDALVLLAAENGRLVTKDRFHDEVWRGIPVTDEALTQCIRSLRRALDDDAAAPRYIETVPRHGYRFIAPLESPVDAPGKNASSGKAPALSIALDAGAAALGGGAAGVMGGLFYLSVGLVNPSMGTASALLVLVSINLLLGLLAGGAVGLGVTLPHSSGGGSWKLIAGGAVGGLVVGAIAHMIGTDLFQLLFGQSPGKITGAGEGALLGAAVGTGLVVAQRASSTAFWGRALPGFVAGAMAGLGIALVGGKLMAGSLAELAARFPGSRLGIDNATGLAGGAGLGAAGLIVATTLEGALFTGCVVLAILVSRRLRQAG